jgi:hypothetical protein
MWIGAMSALPGMSSAFHPDVRLTPGQQELVIDALCLALEDAELTIDELDREVVRATGRWAGDLVMPAFGGLWPRWRQAMSLAGRRGAYCLGATRGGKVTYTSTSRYLAGAPPLDPPSAVSALVERYLLAYGPATPDQFARWLGAPPAWAGAVFGSPSGSRQLVDFDGVQAWVKAGDIDVPDDRPRGVRLLPYFDAYVVACQPRERLFPGRAAERALVPSGQAGNFPVLLVDGVVAGVWNQRRAGRHAHITVEPLQPLSATRRRQLAAEVERIGAALEADADLTVGTVSVGPHA